MAKHVRHSCIPWVRLGINCPGALLEEAEKKKRKERKNVDVEELPKRRKAEEVVPMERSNSFDPHARNRDVFVPIVVHRKAKQRANTQFQQAELAMLLALYQDAILDARGRRGPKISLPAQMREVAEAMGARGMEATLWAAAAAAVVAVTVAAGAAAARAIPGFIAPGGQGVPMGGLHFQAPLFEGVKKRFLELGFEAGRLPGGGGPIL